MAIIEAMPLDNCQHLVHSTRNAQPFPPHSSTLRHLPISLLFSLLLTREFYTCFDDS